MNKKYTKENLQSVVAKCLSFRQVLKELNLKGAGGNYSNIKIRIKQFNLSTSHFKGQGWSKGRVWTKKSFNIKDRLVENSTYKSGLPYSTSKLRELLLKHNLKAYECEKCNNTEWLGKPIKLELHHINGISNDNRIENLQLLCPNCHSYTDNYRGKNIRNKSY